MSHSRFPSVFVCGATGSQGGALARQLRELDWTVRATVRDPTSTAASVLRAIGVELTQGDWDDLLSLETAIAGCEKLFLCSLPDFSDMGRELRQAERIVQIAQATGVKQVVVSTSLGVFTLEEDQEHIRPDSFMAKHLSSKKGVEEAVRNAGFEHWTILRPAFFMANFLEPKVARYPEPREKGTWTTAMTPETSLALIDHTDIATFATSAFQHPAIFHDRAFGLASEMMTVQETLNILGEAAGRSLVAVFLTEDQIAENQKNSNVFTDSQVSMRYMSRYIDMDEIRSIIQPTSLTRFLERNNANVMATYRLKS
jgi:uncharacterized protein YbjT (DUF2867 family)